MQPARITASALLCAFLSLPAMSVAGEFDIAVKAANAAIDKAAAAGYEWRDSRKFLKQAMAAEKSGDHAKAMKLVIKARMQGEIALAQSDKEQRTAPSY